MREVLLDTLFDSLKMLPFLFGAYLLLEYMEHRASDKLRQMLERSGSGVAVGALLGCLPQCGFSVAAANLYAGRLITAGTLVAVFVSTSDEALPVLLAHPDRWNVILPLLACKVVLAVAAGLAVDALGRRRAADPRTETEHIHELCTDCGCDEHSGILRPALWHTGHIFVFVGVVMLLLNMGIHYLGQQRISAFLLTNSPLQPVLAALLGFIPNCAVSVALTELYLAGGISFGSAVAGLSTGAGLGLMVLWRANRDPRGNLRIMAATFVAGSLAGVLLQLLM